MCHPGSRAAAVRDLLSPAALGDPGQLAGASFRDDTLRELTPFVSFVLFVDKSLKSPLTRGRAALGRCA